MAGYWSCLLSEAAAGSTLRDAGTGKDASTSLAAGDGSLTEATILCCSASTESTGSTVEGGFVGLYNRDSGESRNKLRSKPTESGSVPLTLVRAPARTSPKREMGSGLLSVYRRGGLN